MSKKNPHLNGFEKRFNDIEKTQIVLSEDIKHIRGRIDEGIGKTISEIWKMVNSLVADNNQTKIQVKEHAWWIGKLKSAIIWIALVGVIGGAISVAFVLLKKGL